jgi:hypothetical protein
LTKLSRKGAEARLESPVDTFTNLEIRLDGDEAKAIAGTLYAKIIGTIPGTKTDVSICFTSTPPEIDSLFRTLLAQATAVEPDLVETKRQKDSRSSMRKNGKASKAVPGTEPSP